MTTFLSYDTVSFEEGALPLRSAVAWVRRATDDEETRASAAAEVASQREVLVKAGYPAARIVTIEIFGASGLATGQDSAIWSLIAAIEHGRVDALAVRDAHRLTRSIDAGRELARVCTMLGCRVLLGGVEDPLFLHPLSWTTPITG